MAPYKNSKIIERRRLKLAIRAFKAILGG